MHHLPIRADATADHLEPRASELLDDEAMRRRGWSAHGESWTWIAQSSGYPATATIGEKRASRRPTTNAVVTVTLTDRYFRAIARDEVPLFLHQFSTRAGEPSTGDGDTSPRPDPSLDAGNVVWAQRRSLARSQRRASRPDGWLDTSSRRKRRTVLFAYVRRFFCRTGRRQSTPWCSGVRNSRPGG